MRHWVVIDEKKGAYVDGKRLNTSEEGKSLIDELYRNNIGDYPKYFKMDLLCKVGFVATELLLNQEAGGNDIEHRTSRGTAERAILLFNRSGSLATDSNYQATIQDDENYYPSPALFVYTLANIVTGEIAIRNKYYGDTNFVVMEEKKEESMAELTASLFADKNTKSAITGWVECDMEGHFEARVAIIDREDDTNIEIKKLLEWTN